MSLDEVFNENPHISQYAAIKCLREHGCDGSDLEDFFATLGDNDEYSSKEVLEFLGY